MPEVPGLFDPLDYALGALVALARAKELGYQDRDFPLGDYYRKKVEKLSQEFAQGSIPTDNLWLAGFYFNSALVRIASDYERVLKVLAGVSQTDVPTLLRQLGLATPPHLDGVRREVNDLKHDKDGLLFSRNVKFDEAVVAMEELVSLIENNQTKLANNLSKSSATT